jgi:hypothetical protein
VRIETPRRSSILAIAAVTALGVGVAAHGETDTGLVMVAQGTVAGEPFDVSPAIWDDETGEMTGLAMRVAVTSSDPRLAGTMSVATTGAGSRYGKGAIAIQRSSYRLVNDDGAWVGQGQEAEARTDLDGPAVFHAGSLLLEGEGGYEGMTAYGLVEYEDTVPLIKAVIIENALPPPPGLIAPQAE